MPLCPSEWSRPPQLEGAVNLYYTRGTGVGSFLPRFSRRDWATLLRRTVLAVAAHLGVVTVCCPCVGHSIGLYIIVEVELARHGFHLRTELLWRLICY
jgi:hypothetical protein